MKNKSEKRRVAFMWLKRKKINLLEKSIENLGNILQEGNYVEWAYLLRK